MRATLLTGLVAGSAHGAGVPSAAAPTASVASAIPPLTPAQRAALLDGTTDHDPQLEQPGLHALLRNAASWSAGTEHDAAAPDWDSLYADPASHRGELLRVEGELLRRGTRRLDRAGPWGRNAIEWVVQVTNDPVDVVVVLRPGAPDPESAPGAPGRGNASVRLPARFYKVWRAENVGHAGGEGRFLVFVGPARTAGGPDEATSRSMWTAPLVVFALVLTLLTAVRMLGRIRQGRTRRSTTTPIPEAPVCLEDADAASLPEDPPEAMRILADRAGRDRPRAPKPSPPTRGPNA